MLSAAYLLMAAGLPHLPAWGALGAALGIGYAYFAHATSGTADLELDAQGERNPLYAYKALLIHTLHAAPEGLAIGVAMVVSVPFGIFMAAAIAVHNVPEAMALCSMLQGQGDSVGRTAWLAAATRASQVLLAVSTYAVLVAAPLAVPWTLGFAVGALVYLVMVDLLPDSYRQAGPTSIALVTVLAMGIVVLLSPSLS